MARRYVVVGGSSGIGAQLVRDLSEAGDEVVEISRGEEAQAEGAQHLQADVCAFDTQLPSLDGPLDGLVYLPGSINLKPLTSLKLDDFRRDWEINVLGAVRVIQALLPQLKKGTRPSVVLVSSVAATVGMPFHASIASAKAAVEGLTRSLAAELAPTVRVNAVAPSLTDTPLAAQLLADEKKRERSADRHPLKRVGTPEDIAAGIAYLLGEQSGWMTGQVLHIDGGLSEISL